MPLTPFHMGPGILVKALLQDRFSLMVFGWSQIMMDLQPLIAFISDQDSLHGFTHTYVGSSFIAIFSAVTGKYLAQWALIFLSKDTQQRMNIHGWVACLSAWVGSYSHVVLDSIMHTDIEPLSPFSHSNGLLGLISVWALHKLCIYSGFMGTVWYFAVSYRASRHHSHSKN